MLVWIDEAKKPDAFLWRPPAGMTYVGEAIGSKIAWPETNVVIENVNATTSSRTANVVLSPTVMCILYVLIYSNICIDNLLFLGSLLFPELI